MVRVLLSDGDILGIHTAITAYIEELHNTRQGLRFSIWSSENGDDVADIEYKKEALPHVEMELKRYQRLLVWWDSNVATDLEDPRPI